MAYSSFITAGRAHINSFGTNNLSQFWLLTQYKYERNGNQVNYIVRLTLQYRYNSTTNTGTGTYNYPIAVKCQFNGGTASAYQQITSGGTWTSSKGAYTDIGYKEFNYSITNTTGSGTVSIKSYGQNTQTSGFDNPGWYTYSGTIPPLSTYTVTFNAQGGTGAPSALTATIGDSITIPKQKPSKSTTVTTPYVVTFNGNGGCVDETSVTSYSRTGNIFSSWNTQSDGSGTTYNSEDTFTATTNTILYAQWSNTTARDAIDLPSGSKNGYTLLGYGTSANATTYVADPYTPSGNITLYAIWGESPASGWMAIRPVIRINV